jgi:hypothetical protein
MVEIKVQVEEFHNERGIGEVKTMCVALDGISLGQKLC